MINFLNRRCSPHILGLSFSTRGHLGNKTLACTSRCNRRATSDARLHKGRFDNIRRIAYLLLPGAPRLLQPHQPHQGHAPAGSVLFEGLGKSGHAKLTPTIYEQRETPHMVAVSLLSSWNKPERILVMRARWRLPQREENQLPMIPGAYCYLYPPWP